MEGERDLGAQPFHVRLPDRVQRAEFGGRQQLGRLGEAARVELGPRGGQGAGGACLRVRRQFGGAFQEGGGRDPATTGERAARRVLQLPGDVLVRAGGGVRAVPGAAVGVLLRVGDLGEGAVHGPQVRDVG
ncbi:hypothetical protein [Umezawaea sp. NPDC059074]|uniref:hypothetical protein n=1 Tax=Umezawaea sp. NPDC059074 TaxID=3346716 RepID=UPI0036A89534